VGTENMKGGMEMPANIDFTNVLLTIISLFVAFWIMERLWGLARAGWKGVLVGVLFVVFVNVGYEWFQNRFLDNAYGTKQALEGHPITQPLIVVVDTAAQSAAQALNVQVLPYQSTGSPGAGAAPQYTVPGAAPQYVVPQGAQPQGGVQYETRTTLLENAPAAAWNAYVRAALERDPGSQSLPKGWQGVLRGTYGAGAATKNKFWVEAKDPAGTIRIVTLSLSSAKKSADTVLKAVGAKEKGLPGKTWNFSGEAVWPPSYEACPACYRVEQIQVPLPSPTSAPPSPSESPPTGQAQDTCVKIINSIGLNVRPGPSTAGDPVDWANYGDVFPILETAANGWRRIGEGRWVSGGASYTQQVACP
jgi:hypothetical protein